MASSFRGCGNGGAGQRGAVQGKKRTRLFVLSPRDVNLTLGLCSPASALAHELRLPPPPSARRAAALVVHFGYARRWLPIAGVTVHLALGLCSPASALAHELRLPPPSARRAAASCLLAVSHWAWNEVL